MGAASVVATLKRMREANGHSVRHLGRVEGIYHSNWGKVERGMLGATVAPVRMHHSIAHPRAKQTGLTAQDFEPDGKAADEVQRLWVYARMNLWSKRHAAAA